jgi:hypothetical protein
MTDIRDALRDYLEASHPVSLEEAIDSTATPPPQTSVTRHLRPVLVAAVAALVVALLVGGAGLLSAGDPGVADQPFATTQTVPTTTTATTSPTSTSAPATSTTIPTTEATAGGQLAPPTSFVPPEIYPPEGLSLNVVGVAHDGSLNLRLEPGSTRIVTTLGPLDVVESKGEGRELETTTWWKVDIEPDTLIDGTIGWVNASYLASSVSARVDLTSYVEGEYGSRPAALTMAELGQIVAETLVSEDYPSRFAMVVAPASSESVVATFDVVSEDPLGLRIALRGGSGQNIWRFRVTATLDDGRFHLYSVEGQAFIHACGCWLSE